MPDPRYQLLGQADPAASQAADDFFASTPDTSWINARGIIPNGQPQQGGYGPQVGPGGMVQPNPYQQAQQTYEKSIVGGIQGFDITKPDYQQKVQDYFLNHQDPNAANYPRVQAEVNASLRTHQELKSFMQKNPKAAETYSNLINGGATPEDAVGQLREQTARDADNQKTALLLAQHGEDPEDYRDKNGNIDSIAAARGIYKSQQAGQFTRSAVNDEELGKLGGLSSALKDANKYIPSDEEKKAYMAANPGATWSNAYDTLKNNAVSEAKQGLLEKVQTLHEANRAVPSTFWKALGMDAPSYQYNAKGKARDGSSQFPGQQASQFQAGPSSFNPDTGQWTSDNTPPVAASSLQGVAPSPVAGVPVAAPETQLFGTALKKEAADRASALNVESEKQSRKQAFAGLNVPSFLNDLDAYAKTQNLDSRDVLADILSGANPGHLTSIGANRTGTLGSKRPIANTNYSLPATRGSGIEPLSVTFQDIVEHLKNDPTALATASGRYGVAPGQLYGSAKQIQPIMTPSGRKVSVGTPVKSP